MSVLVRRLLGSALWVPAAVGVLVIRILRPFVVIRIGSLYSERLGHFALNTELYLCERDAGINQHGRRCIDLFYHRARVANTQLDAMWRRLLHIWPARLLHRVEQLNGR